MTSAAHACARCATPLEEGDLRCSICGLTAPLLASAATRVVAKVLRCTECGAAVAYSAEVGAPRCAFCSSVMRVEEPVDPVEQAEHVVPFRVMPDEAHARLRGWLRGLGFFRPSDLASSAALERVQPIFWAAWIVNADALVSFAADSNAGARRSAWAPHAGQTRLTFSNLLVSASRGLTSEEAFRLTHFYNLALAEPVPRGSMNAQGLGADDSRAALRAPEGASIEQFDAQRSAARRTIVEAIRATAAAELTQGVIPGSAFRNVNVAIVLHGFTTRRVALPTYILAYRYRDKTYRAIVHGQDGQHVIGDAPYSIGKILLVIALGLLAVAAIIAVIVLTGAR